MSILSAPSWLVLLLAVPLLGGLFAWGARRHAAALEALVGAKLAPRLAPRPPPWSRAARVAAVLTFVAMASLALARPRWGHELKDLTTHGVDVMALVDVSRSMGVKDVAPSRLDLAKAVLGALASRATTDRLGLVAFAGSQHLMCPLTLDRSAFALFLDLLDTGLVPVPGTDIAGAIRKGVGLLAHAPGKPVLLLISDGESLMGDPLAAAKEAAAKGILILTIGVGTPAGQPVPLVDEKGQVTGYQKDRDGQVVTSRLDESSLAAIAEATGGRYFPLRAGGAALEALAAELDRLPSSERTMRAGENKPERFQIPLALGVVALVVESLIGRLARPRGVAARAGVVREERS